MKKVIIIFLVIVILCGVGFYVYLLRQRAIISTTLSDRSKEYLKSRSEKNTEDTSLEYVDIDKKQAQRNVEVTIGDCFSIKIPFQVTNTRFKKDECFGNFSIENPKGILVVYENKGKIGDFDQVPGVSLRRIKSSEYKEEKKIINNIQYVLFEKKGDTYEKIAFSYDSAAYFTASLIGYSNENLDDKLDEILASRKEIQ